MSTIEVTSEDTELKPPPVEIPDKKKDKKPEGKADAKDDAPEDKRERAAETSPEIKKMKISEDATVREIVEQLGNEGAFTIKIHRKDPEYARDASGKQVMTRGYCETVDRKIDEHWIQQKYGGGIYELTFRQKGGKYITHRTISIAGEPSLDQLPKAAAPTAAGVVIPQPAPESSTVVTKTLDLMSKQLDKAEERAERANGSGGNDAVVEILRDQIRSRDAEIAGFRTEIREMMANLNRPPPQTVEDKAQNRLFDKLIDQDSARLLAQANKYESEIRMLRENALENERRLQDRGERDRQEQRNSHEREIAMMKQSHSNEITTLKTSQEVALSAARSSYETQTKVADSENRRLERENDRLQDELKELRAKKDKSLPEQLKEINALKELIGGDEQEGSPVEKVVEALTNPEAIAAVGQLFQKNQPQQQAQAAQQAQASAPQKRHVVRNIQTGEKMIVEGNTIRPAKKIPPPGTPPEVAALPPMDPEDVKRIVGYLENACAAGTDPALVIQSFGPHIPDSIKGAVRDLGGVDQFLIKVAKLPSSSPLLANQAGRNWCKKLGKALAGE